MKFFSKKPPFVFELLLRISCRSDEISYVLGDFDEIYCNILKRAGVIKAVKWYLIQILRTMSLSIKTYYFWIISLFHNYIKLGFRSILRKKGFYFLNITGLVSGLTCFLLLFVYINREYSYDNYHPDKNRIFRISTFIEAPASFSVFAYTTGNLAPILCRNFPEVENAARIYCIKNQKVTSDNKSFTENRILFADSQIFEILSIPFLRRDSKTTLKGTDCVVITKETAEKYFGRKNPIGKNIHINDDEYQITGVLENCQKTTHLKYDIICGFKNVEKYSWLSDWTYSQVYTYVKLYSGYDPQVFEKKIKNLSQNYLSVSNSGNYKFTYFLQRLTELHTDSKYKGLTLEFEPEEINDTDKLKIFALINLLILLVSYSGFLSLSTGHAQNRSNAIAVRQIAGGSKGQLLTQLFIEYFIIIFIIIIMTYCSAILFLRAFNILFSANLNVIDIFNLKFVFFMGLTALLTGIFLSKYLLTISPCKQPKSLFNRFKFHDKQKVFFKKILIALQLSLLVFLVISTMIVRYQIKYMKDNSCWINETKKIVIPVADNSVLKREYRDIKDKFKKIEGITGVSFSSHVPGSGSSRWSSRRAGRLQDTEQIINCIYVDTDFINEYGINIVKGRNFIDNNKKDVGYSYLINEAAMKAFKWKSSAEAIDKEIVSGVRHIKGPVVGVVDDFHYKGLQKKIEPLIIGNSPGFFHYITLSMENVNFDEVLFDIEGACRQILVGFPFKYHFFDKLFDKQYKSEKQLEKAFSIISFITLFLSCVTLACLSSFMILKRKKEINIRRILGASTSNILFFITKDFIGVVTGAVLTGGLFSLIFAGSRLRFCTYKISLNIFPYITGCVLAAIIFFLILSLLSFKVSRENPAESLRVD